MFVPVQEGHVIAGEMGRLLSELLASGEKVPVTSHILHLTPIRFFAERDTGPLGRRVSGWKSCHSISMQEQAKSSDDSIRVQD